MRLDLAITGIGSLNPAGLSALVALHSVRTGISRLALQPFPDRVRQWVAGATIPLWVPELRDRRLSALADRAIRAALERAGVHPDDNDVRRSTAVILGCPDGERPGYSFPPPKLRFRQLIAGGLLESVAVVDFVAAGACSAQVGLVRAAELLSSNRVARCVIGAVDTQLQLRTVRWHEDNFRLKCSYVTDGLMPAEAACFLVLERDNDARERGARVVAHIVSSSTAREHANILSDQPNTAAGLTVAVRQALDAAGVRPPQVGIVWADLNGESYRAREWAFTEVRLGFTTATELIHPADVHGDLGAATDASLLGLAAMCHGTGWSDGKPVVVFSGSEGGTRAATVLMPAGGGASFLQVSRRLPRVLSDTFVLPDPSAREDFRRAVDPPRTYFEWQLREDHLDALAALHYQRLAILRDRSISWTRLAEPEQRILNHVDAAVAGGPSSIAAIVGGLAKDEEGAGFAGAFLVGCLPASENFARLEASLDEAAPSSIAGATAGLVHAPDSEGLRRFVRRAVRSHSAGVQTLAVTVAGVRRIGIERELPPLLTSDVPQLLVAVADTCRRLRVNEAIPGLELLLAHESLDVRRAALFALLRLAPVQTAAFARANIAQDSHFGGGLTLCVGIAGQLHDAVLLEHRVQDGTPDLASITAIGILGSPISVPTLIRLLHSDDDAVLGVTAEALDLMAGLHVRERAAVKIPVDSADGGAPEVRELERVTTSIEFWTNWWQQMRQQLDVNARWRRGTYFTVGACIEELADAAAAFESRWRASQELVARARADVPFEPEWFVPLQEQSIREWRSWWAQQQGRG